MRQRESVMSISGKLCELELRHVVAARELIDLLRRCARRKSEDDFVGDETLLAARRHAAAVISATATRITAVAAAAHGRICEPWNRAAIAGEAGIDDRDVLNRRRRQSACRYSGCRSCRRLESADVPAGGAARRSWPTASHLVLRSAAARAAEPSPAAHAPIAAAHAPKAASEAARRGRAAVNYASYGQKQAENDRPRISRRVIELLRMAHSLYGGASNSRRDARVTAATKLAHVRSPKPSDNHWVAAMKPTTVSSCSSFTTRARSGLRKLLRRDAYAV